MTGYIASFTVYTCAMIGLIFIAYVVAKKSMLIDGFSAKKNNKFLSVETSLSLAPRKTLYVVKAGDEKFLISSDVERTSFLTKLAAENMNGNFSPESEKNALLQQEEAFINMASDFGEKTEQLEGKSFLRKILLRLES